MKFTSTLFFVQQYGLLGFMVEAPVNPNFLLDKEVILKEDNFISKKCVMKAQDYFDLFFPFANKEEMSFSIVGMLPMTHLYLCSYVWITAIMHIR